MIKVTVRDGESGDRLIKRFGSHIKSCGMLKAFRNKRYFSQDPKKREIREAAIAREKYRKENKRKQFLS
ncbi:MAG: 30S ribosomal protein S21 [Candidatus Gracilibacteria bacterium]|nr:30S ribosomal protein S21 [Candidatus Gracilibacteria bacterium]